MKYALHKSLGIWRHVSPPFNRLAFIAARPVLALLPKGMRGVRCKKIKERGLRALLIEPEECRDSLPCLVYFHGGGFVFNAAPYHYKNAAEYAVRAGCKVLFVDYPLAPKNTLKDILESCYRAYIAARTRAAEWGTDPLRIAVGGDSAGGYIAAEIVVRAARSGDALPVFVMLVYPVLDSRMQTDSMKIFTDTPMWNARLNKKMWDYCRGADVHESVGCGDLSFFPQTYIEYVQFDCLADEAESFAASLKDYNVDVTLNYISGGMHGFDIARKSPLEAEALDRRTEALRTAFGGD